MPHPYQHKAKPSTKRGREEAQTQHAAMTAVPLMVPGALPFAVPNGGSRDVREAVQLKRQGVVAGWPDVGVVLPGGTCVWLEFKSTKGRLSPQQRHIHDLLRALGAEVAVVRSLEDIEAVLGRFRDLRASVKNHQQEREKHDR